MDSLRDHDHNRDYRQAGPYRGSTRKSLHDSAKHGAKVGQRVLLLLRLRRSRSLMALRICELLQHCQHWMRRSARCVDWCCHRNRGRRRVYGLCDGLMPCLLCNLSCVLNRCTVAQCCKHRAQIHARTNVNSSRSLGLETIRTIASQSKWIPLELPIQAERAEQSEPLQPDSTDARTGLGQFVKPQSEQLETPSILDGAELV